MICHLAASTAVPSKSSRKTCVPNPVGHASAAGGGGGGGGGSVIVSSSMSSVGGFAVDREEKSAPSPDVGTRAKPYAPAAITRDVTSNLTQVPALTAPRSPKLPE